MLSIFLKTIYNKNSKQNSVQMVNKTVSILAHYLSSMKTAQIREKILEAERNRWREVLIRLVSIIQSLAERNMGLRGFVDTLHANNNGNFLKEVELLAKFDTVLKEHVRRIDSGANHTTYLGKTIQNELIACISDTILRTIVVQIKE